ncbi:uncharacterized protein A1O5_01768 [Cladophialophora psammophila CBS 110553]|uniref:Uncharacterized protein n=1 Tax=Cladophialophora psammophila CBS 110553 TaxID=1182543 RepID=W9X3K9_9EURO|nr:uncharacterized protein A1O5_01768 [Cladophialophora psammophila CBS 110553]EXJ75072.1 hypothetical protein A1O5_01768 [Cladophialophora psammophila CBS 110553]
MATFIAYQPRANKTSFRNRVFGKSSTVGLHSQLSIRNSSKYPQQERPTDNTGFVALVDLTTSARDSAREYLVEQEILGLTAHDPDRRGVQVARVRSNDAIDSDVVEESEECDNHDNIDDKSEISNLLSPTAIFSRSDSGFGGSAGLSSKASTSPISIDRIGEVCWQEDDC